MKTYQETYVKFTLGEGDNSETKVFPEKKFEKLDPKPDPEQIQTFTLSEIESVDEAESLYGPDLINIINRGGVLKQQNAVRRLLTSEDFTPVEGTYDLTSICAEPTERQAATPVEKAAKSLAKLSPAEIAELLAKFAPANA
jgi:hypothetical protein